LYRQIEFILNLLENSDFRIKYHRLYLSIGFLKLNQRPVTQRVIYYVVEIFRNDILRNVFTYGSTRNLHIVSPELGFVIP